MDLGTSKLLETDFVKLQQGDNFVRFLDEGEEVESQKYKGKLQIVFSIDLQNDVETLKGKKLGVSSRSLIKELAKFQSAGGLIGKTFRLTRSGEGTDTRYIVVPQPRQAAQATIV